MVVIIEIEINSLITEHTKKRIIIKINWAIITITTTTTIAITIGQPFNTNIKIIINTIIKAGNQIIEGNRKCKFNKVKGITVLETIHSE